MQTITPSKLSTAFKKIHGFILNILFPIKCLSCKKENEWICNACFSQIILQIDHVCGVCEKMITPDGRTCQACKKKNSLSGLVVATSYKHHIVASAIHLYKYRFISDLHIPLGKLLVKALRKTDIPLPDVIIPIPLHQRRLRWRGFNQSAILAKYVAQNILPQTELPFEENILQRKRYTMPQMAIKNYRSRKQNITGAFSVVEAEKIINKTILLVDDIATTGSTIFECARILKNAGAKDIYATVIARQEIKA